MPVSGSPVAIATALPAPPSAVVNAKARASLALALAAIAMNILSRAVPSPLSLVISVLALAMLVTAIVLGHVARREIRRTNESGAGQALAGMLIGYIAFGISIVALVVILVVTAAYVASF